MKYAHPSVEKMWNTYLLSIGQRPQMADIDYSAWCFSDNEEDSNMLIEKVLNGTKRAVVELFKQYEQGVELFPKPGDYSVITDWDGVAKCIIRIIKVTILPFRELSTRQIKLDGAQCNLEQWRHGYRKSFKNELNEYGWEFNDSMSVVFEEFEVLYRE